MAKPMARPRRREPVQGVSLAQAGLQILSFQRNKNHGGTSMILFLELAGITLATASRVLRLVRDAA